MFGDFNKDGKVNFKDLVSFLTQKVFGFPLYLLMGLAGGAAWYFGLLGKKKGGYRRR